MLLSSHLLDEVEKTCDFAAIVDQGRVVAQGTIHELVARRPARDRHRLPTTPSRPRALLAARARRARAPPTTRARCA